MAFVNDKVVLITGGSGAIGSAMVKEVLQNGGKGIAILDWSEESGQKLQKEIEATFGPNKAIFIKTDVTNKEQLEEAFETTVKTFKQLDIVVNNAGIVDEVDWEKTIAVNLVAVIRGSYLAMEKYLPKYRSGEEGVIVNTSSTGALVASDFVPVYCATKRGVLSIGESFGQEEYYKRYQVRVITICPGQVNTPFIREKRDKIILREKADKFLDTQVDIWESTECVAKTLIKVINEGGNGSIWIVKDEKPPYEIAMPDFKTLKK